MHGLLLKDLYMLKKHFRAFFVMDLVMIFAPVFADGTDFMLLYPCLLTGMIGMSMISFEEKEKWNVFAATLPLGGAEIVSAKYLLSLLLGTTLTLLTTTVQAGIMLTRRTPDFGALFSVTAVLFAVSLLPTALLLPFIYKFGAEKGRLIYLFTIAISCSFIGAGGGFESTSLLFSANGDYSILMLGAAVLLYGISWCISIAVYQKREI